MISRLRATDLFAAGERRLIVLEMVSIDRYREFGLYGVQARLELCAVIAFDDGAWRALAADGQVLALTALARRYPELPALLPEAFIGDG